MGQIGIVTSNIKLYNGFAPISRKPSVPVGSENAHFHGFFDTTARDWRLNGLRWPTHLVETVDSAQKINGCF